MPRHPLRFAPLRFAPLRFAGAVLLAAGLAACGGREGTSAGSRPYTAIARFLPGDEVTTIQVWVSDRQALRSAELVGPDGVMIAAESIDANQVTDYQQPFFRPPVGGETASGGVAVPFGGFGNFAPAGSQTATSGQIRSIALFRLADPANYSKDWRLWHIRLGIGDPPHVNVVNLAAPQPPASL
jgi:hypothetical protein